MAKLHITARSSTTRSLEANSSPAEQCVSQLVRKSDVDGLSFSDDGLNVSGRYADRMQYRLVQTAGPLLLIPIIARPRLAGRSRVIARQLQRPTHARRLMHGFRHSVAVSPFPLRIFRKNT